MDGVGDDGNTWGGAKRRAFSYCYTSNNYVFSCHSHVLSASTFNEMTQPTLMTSISVLTRCDPQHVVAFVVDAGCILPILQGAVSDAFVDRLHTNFVRTLPVCRHSN